MINSIAELRRKYGPGNIPKETVSRETVSLERRARGHGIDWTDAEIAILKRQDLAPKAMAALLPGRSGLAIRIKRHRLGVARPNQRHAIGSVA
jgi:hypothetical protein